MWIKIGDCNAINTDNVENIYINTSKNLTGVESYSIILRMVSGSDIVYRQFDNESKALKQFSSLVTKLNRSSIS